jgi:hypothetical protein
MMQTYFGTKHCWPILKYCPDIFFGGVGGGVGLRLRWLLNYLIIPLHLLNRDWNEMGKQ